VRYPILPKVTRLESEQARREILEIRHSSLYAPRDFDISPYFEVVKPTIVNGFNYQSLHWADLPRRVVEDKSPNAAASPAACELPAEQTVPAGDIGAPVGRALAG